MGTYLLLKFTSLYVYPGREIPVMLVVFGNTCGQTLYEQPLVVCIHVDLRWNRHCTPCSHPGSERLHLCTHPCATIARENGSVRLALRTSTTCWHNESVGLGDGEQFATSFSSGQVAICPTVRRQRAGTRRAWRTSPAVWGLPGFSQWPRTNRGGSRTRWACECPLLRAPAMCALGAEDLRRTRGGDMAPFGWAPCMALRIHMIARNHFGARVVPPPPVTAPISYPHCPRVHACACIRCYTLCARMARCSRFECRMRITQYLPVRPSFVVFRLAATSSKLVNGELM